MGLPDGFIGGAQFLTQADVVVVQLHSRVPHLVIGGAQGLVLFMQQFCDPEEMEYPYLKKALDDAGIPHIKLGIDQQMRDFGQAATALEAFADMLDTL